MYFFGNIQEYSASFSKSSEEINRCIPSPYMKSYLKERNLYMNAGCKFIDIYTFFNFCFYGYL